jgi:hypothetical protein
MQLVGNKKNAQYENCVFTGSAKEYLGFMKYNSINYQFLCFIFIKKFSRLVERQIFGLRAIFTWFLTTPSKSEKAH